MSEPFEPLHQPPSPRELREVPPATSRCARVRGLLRDFADGDLSPSHRAEVEGHVHDCRVCGLALSRSEFEVLQLRRAFGDGWVPAQPRPGFARRAVARLLLESPELALEAAAAAERAEAVAESGPSMLPRVEVPRVDLARRVLARTAAELIADDRRSRRHRARWLALATAASALLVAALGLFWQNVVDVSANFRLTIVRAQQVWHPGANTRMLLRAGDGLGEGSLLELDEDGSADVEWYDAQIEGEQPAAQIRMRGDGQLRVDERLLLLRGSMEIESQRAMSLLLADGATVELGAGVYHISVVDQMGPFDQMLPSVGRYGVRVETLDGDAAYLVRDDVRNAVIAAGQSGRYSRGLLGIAVENLPPVGVSSPLAAAAARKPVEDPEDPDLRGTVLDAFGAPVAEARVQLFYPTDAGLAERLLATDRSGVYELPQGSGIRDGYALVAVSPPPGRSDLSFLPLDARQLLVTEGAGFELATTTLTQSSLLRGRLLGSPNDRQHARVLPLFYDEALGKIWPWFDGAVTTDRDGRFSIVGLPSRLLPHQSAGLLVFHSNSDTIFQQVPLPGSPAFSATELLVQPLALREMLVRGLPPSRVSVILEEVGDMPGGAALRRHVVSADSQGQAASVRMGRGRLWLEVAGGGSPMLRPIAETAIGQVEVAGELLARGSVLPPTVAVPGVQGNSLEIAVQTRFTGARLEPTQGEDLHVQDVFGPLASGAQVFALAPSAAGGYRSRFLGLSRPSSGLRIAFETGETEVFVVGQDGRACARANVASLREGVVAGRLAPIRLQANGTAQLAPELVPHHHVRTLGTTWQPTGVGHAGARPRLYRILSENDAWKARDLAPGAYQVLDDYGRTFHVTVEPGQQVEIR